MQKINISTLLAEVYLSNLKSKTYSKATHSIEVIIQANITKKIELNIAGPYNTPAITYWLHKMHRTPICARFIVISKNCSTKPLSDTISKNFKIIFNGVERFQNKSFSYSGCKKFWIVQNVKKKVKVISTFDFSTFHTIIPRKLLIIVLSEVIDFAFKSKVRKCIDFSETSMYWISKGAGRRYVIKETLVDAMPFIISKYFFTIGDIVFKRDISMPTGIDPAPFWANFFIYLFAAKYMKQLILNGSKYINIMGFLYSLMTFVLKTMTVSL